MYEEFFSFAESPFSLTPDPKFFYSSREHEEAFSHILFGIQERKGFIVISGEVGTGKTTLCRHVLAKLDPKIKTALIFNPNLTTIELLRTINQDFGLSGAGKTKKELVDELNVFLLDALSKKGNALLIIDEAQNLPIECLEEIRMLSNLETTKEKLLQILLVGQPELRDKLRLQSLRQLNQRVALRCHLDPLSLEETRAYIDYRLRTAGGSSGASFSDKAVRLIHEASGGVPRLINVACDKALLAAYVAEKKIIDARLVKKAIKELSDRSARTALPGGFPRRLKVRWAGGSALAILIAGGVVLAYPEMIRLLGGGGGAPRGLTPSFSRTFSPDLPLPALPFAFDLHGAYRVTSASESAPAAALTLLRRWGVAGISQTEGNLQALRDQDFNQWMGEQGFLVFRFPADVQKIALLGYPVMVSLSTPLPDKDAAETRWVVLSRLGDAAATLLDPLAGERRMEIETLRRSLSGDAVLIWKAIPGIALPFTEADELSVTALQNILREKGFYQGDVTGRWGESSAEAIRFLQQKAGLPESGLFTTESYIVLSRIFLGDRVPSLADGA